MLFKGGIRVALWGAQEEARRRNGIFHVERPSYLGRACHPLLLITRPAAPRAPAASARRVLRPHCPLRHRPSWPVGRAGGLPIVPEQQPNVVGALVIDEAWKLVPEFN